MSTRIYLGTNFVRLFSFETEAVDMAQLLSRDGEAWSPIEFDCGWLVQEQKGTFLDADGVIPEKIAEAIRERLAQAQGSAKP